MINKKISVIIPVYNGEKYLDESIQSIINQTFTNFELIIINDSSTDNSKNIILKWMSEDNRIKILENKYQKGLPGALNTGLENCTGEYIARADADDINRPYRFLEQIRFFENNPNVSIVGGGYKLFGLNNNREIFHTSNELKLSWKFITNTYFCHPSVMFKSTILNTIKHYPEVACEDFAFFSKILKSYRGTNINKILVDYRQHSSNYSNTAKENIEKSVKKTFEDNYLFYTGSLENSNIFYEFHGKKDLQLKDLSKIINKSFYIGNKIVRLYDNKNILLKSIFIYIIILTDIIIALTKHYLIKVKNFLSK